MGIQGLLPFLKDATEAINIRKFKGHAVAVDTYCWIHRGAVACALQLAKGEKCDQYVRFCLKYVNLLLSLDIKPVLVFDGQHLPAKKSVEDSRRKRRELYSQKGKQLLREGKASEARDAFVKCINVTSEMALEVMKAVRSLDVDCIVAPYEADAQLAYLEKCGYVQAIITEDSDLLAFGCKRVIFKMDTAGNALEIDQSRLNQAVKMGTRFSVEKFRHMCILAGCDYLPSLPGVGLGKARKFMHTVSNLDIQQFLKRMPLQLKLKTSVSQEYIDGFVRANNTFLYQLAYDPVKRKLLPLNPLPPELEGENMDYAGRYMESKLSFELALGNVEIHKMKKIFNFKPIRDKPHNGTPRHKLSIWHDDYEPAPPLHSDDPLDVSRNPTKGQEVSIPSNGIVTNRPTKKRLREDDTDAIQTTRSDAALTSLYSGSPEAKVIKLEDPETIPETPSPGNNQDERTVPPGKPTPRNIFAVRKSQRMDRETRKELLNSEVTVASRFFKMAPELSSENMLTNSENSEEDLVTSQEGKDHIYSPKKQDHGREPLSDLQESTPVVNDSIRNHQRKVRGTTGRLCDKKVDRTSVLDSLQRFRHSQYDEEQAKIKEEFDLQQRKRSPPPFSQSKKRQRRGVFSWSNKSPSTNSTQKTLADSIKSLSAFHRSTSETQLKRYTPSKTPLRESCSQPSQEKISQSLQDDFRLSQGVKDSIESDILSSQPSFISSKGSFSQVSIDSVDKDGPTLSQVLRRDGITFSQLGETSTEESSPSRGTDEKTFTSPGDEELCNVLVDIAQGGEDRGEMDTNAEYETQGEESFASKSNSEDDDDENSAIVNITDASGTLSNKLKSLATNNDRTPVLPSLQIRDEISSSQRSHIIFSDDYSSNDENSPPAESGQHRSEEKVVSSYFKKGKEGERNSNNRPKDTASRSLGPCKVPGLSKRQKKKPSTAQSQPTLMAFMTKKPTGSSKNDPLSPSKLEAMRNITPETDAVYIMDKAAAVRKNIFK